MKGIFVNNNACMGCSVCTKLYSELFEMDGKKASVKEYSDIDTKHLLETIAACPVKAIAKNLLSALLECFEYCDCGGKCNE